MTSVRSYSLPSGKRPACVEDSHLEFLDALEERDAVPLWDARRHLVAEFGLTDYIAGTVLAHWRRVRRRRSEA